jgi:predicted  nucleic acid-binding Zn-ribbon protein
MENNENNGVTTQNTQNTQTETKNYQQEYENQKLEIERLKNAISKTNSENAEYKRQEAERKKKELDSLPEVERLTKELEAERSATKAANEEIAKIKHERSGLENGFTADEVAKLAGTGVDFKVLKEIVSARVEEAVKSAKAEFTKNSTSNGLLGKSNAENSVSYAENLAKKTFANGDEIAKIKEIYKH